MRHSKQITLEKKLCKQSSVNKRDSTDVEPENEEIGCMKETTDELDLHGLTVDEAIPVVDRFLYKSFQIGLRRVWVIHGKGSGILRQAVRRHLSNHT